MQRMFLFFMLISTIIYAQKPMFKVHLSPRIANYKIDVTLDTGEKMLHGSELLTWKNDSKDEVSELQFHLYLNAFKNEASTFMKESKGWHRKSEADKKDGWGWINILKIESDNGTDLTDEIEFIQPDDQNENDQTVIRIPLNNPVKPAEVIKLYIEFESKLPRVFARTGYHQDFYLAGQWFPKIGVYEEAGERYAKKGQWNCHQFHLNSEFFADFGNYDVTITLPQKYVVGATGILLNEIKNEDGTKTLNYYCEDVHDFAWTADPNFVVIEDQWKHVKIKYLVQSQHQSSSQRYIQAVKNSFEYFEEWYGEYPYPTLTIVDPRYRAGGAGGMEYPTFITTTAKWGYSDGRKSAEIVTVHELAHNYWYGLVASNEFEEAWLDEGFTTYAELMVLEKYYNETGGSYFDRAGIRFSNTELTWIFYVLGQKRRDKIFNLSWKYETGGYGVNSYSKPAIMLLTLHNYLGDERMKKVMRTYFERYQFKHPTTQDFINTVNEVSGENFEWFFDQIIFDSPTLDYKLYRITNDPIQIADKGIFDSDSGMIFIGEKELDDAKREAFKDTTFKRSFKSRVMVTREGDMTFPVEVLIKFSDDSEVLEKWDGKERYKVFKYEKPGRVISAEIDPEGKVMLDINPLNNSLKIKSDDKVIYKYGSFWFYMMQNIMHLFTTLI
jgi:hypothetical protein